MTTKQIVKAVGTVATVVVIRFGGMLIRSGLAVNRLLKLAPGLKLASMLFVIAAHPAFASTFTAFGPQTYQRRTGAPVTTSQTFSILNPSTKYSLHVTTDRVSSAII